MLSHTMPSALKKRYTRTRMGGDSGIGRAFLLTPRVTIGKQIDESAT